MRFRARQGTKAPAAQPLRGSSGSWRLWQRCAVLRHGRKLFFSVQIELVKLGWSIIRDLLKIGVADESVLLLLIKKSAPARIVNVSIHPLLRRSVRARIWRWHTNAHLGRWKVARRRFDRYSTRPTDSAMRSVRRSASSWLQCSAANNSRSWPTPKMTCIGRVWRST
jgi:hypothetical protein